VVDAEELMPAARAMAGQMKKLNMTAHANTKVKARRAFLETLDWAIEEDKRHPL
jgi:enoyl-CoA hydratase